MIGCVEHRRHDRRSIERSRALRLAGCCRLVAARGAGARVDGGRHEGARVVGPAHRVQGEPARDRRSEAAPELAARVRGARRRPVGVRDPGRAERGGAPRRPRLVWSSGRVASDESTQRVYEGPALRSGERYHWQVRVWDGGGPRLGLERAGVVGDGPPRAVRLEGELDRARPAGGRRRRARRRCCGASSG